MECPKCGYVMDAFTEECPRCKRLSNDNQLLPNQSQTAERPTLNASPQTSSSSKPSTPQNNTGRVAGGCIGMIFAIVFLCWWLFPNIFSSITNHEQQDSNGQVTSADNIHIISVRIENREQFGIQTPYITGEASYDGGSTISYAQIEFNLYDSNGAQVGSDFVNINNLEPGTTWKFETPVIQNNVASFKVKGITAY